MSEDRYQYTAIIERPTDESLKIGKEEGFKKYYDNLIIPDLEKCQSINKQYLKEKKEPFFPPYILEPITKETKKFLDMYYNKKGDYYSMRGDMVYRVVKNKQLESYGKES